MATNVRAKSKPAKSAAKNANIAKNKGKKKRTNLLKLCSEMSNYVIDANDKEIIRRFKTSITSSTEEDISKTNLDIILKAPKDVEISEFSERIQPYIKHYLFMVKRKKK